MKLEPYIVVESEDGIDAYYDQPTYSRVLSFIAKPGLGDGKGLGYSSIISDAPGADLHSLWKEFANKIGDYVDKYVKAMEKVKLKKGLECPMKISGEGNAYLQVKFEGDINQVVAYYKRNLYYNWHYADAIYDLRG
ncbi:probable methionine--tRNA ligase [Tanacetum coccineum]|uniref:Probable methionine--tRNA ligase n=1 Tax=Tanacetum coccineum TaxID=301880 RepID=A0ABQ5AJQ0_9ASTR